MSVTTKNRLLPIAVAGLCLFAGLAAGIAFNGEGPASRVNADVHNQKSEQKRAQDSELAEIQKQLLRTLVLPEDFKAVPDFSLVTGDSQPVDKTLFDNQWSVVFLASRIAPTCAP